MRVKHDVVIVGGSFGGLAAASQIRGRVLIVDRKPIGSGQRSACGTPLRVPMSLGLGDSVLQVHDQALFHLGSHSFELPGTEPFCTFDYEGFCQGLYALTNAEFVQASVRGVRAEGSEGLIVSTSAGELSARYVVDASGWSAVAASSLDPHVQPRKDLGFGLETTVLHEDEGLHIWLDRGLHPGRLGWLFPAGDHSRAGLASYTGNGVKGDRVAEFALRFGPGDRSLHGGFFPLRLRRPVVGPLFVVGDSAGHCMPLTAEGIRPAVYFGQQCGALLQRVLDEKLALTQAQSIYVQLHDSYRPYYRWLAQHQNWTTRLPAALLAAVMKLAKMTGLSERVLRQYCTMMPITQTHESAYEVADVSRPAAVGIQHRDRMPDSASISSRSGGRRFGLMNTVEVVFVTEGNCPYCNGVRSVLAKMRHEYRHLAINEVHPDSPGGRSIAAEHGLPALPALVVNGHLRLAGEITEKLVRRELEKVKAHRTR